MLLDRGPADQLVQHAAVEAERAALLGRQALVRLTRNPLDLVLVAAVKLVRRDRDVSDSGQ